MIDEDISISIIGLGYVGVTMAVFLASKGINVIGVDIDQNKIEKLSKGIPPFYEEKLEDLLRENLRRKSIIFLTDYDYAITNSSVSFITVGTPSREDGSINLDYIRNASSSIGEALKNKDDYHLVVTRSTVIPGTNACLIKNIIEKYSSKKIGEEWGLCMNPEFLKEGSALKDIEKPSRIVIGEYDKKSGDILEEFYKRVYDDHDIPIIRTSLSTAELIKYANNAFLATKISFINSIAEICENIKGCDIEHIAYVLGLDPRISPSFLRAGLGFGGSCLPKDIKALISFSEKLGIEPILLRSVYETNLRQPLKAIKFCEASLGKLDNRRIAILGLAFKPNTDDIREAPSLRIIEELLKGNAVVVVYDPKAMNRVKQIYEDKLIYASTPIECLRNADCAIIVTEWDEFKKIQPEDFKKYMRKPMVVDGRRVYDPKVFRKHNIEYHAIGLGE